MWLVGNVLIAGLHGFLVSRVATFQGRLFGFQGRNNVLYAIVLFLHYVKTNQKGYLCNVNLAGLKLMQLLRDS